MKAMKKINFENNFLTNKFSLILILLLIIANTNAKSLEKGYFAGKVFDEKSNAPLTGASIKLEGTAFGSVSGKQGKFIIKAVPVGSYNVIISLIGYELKKFKIVIPARDTFFVEVGLKEQAIQTNEIVVSANKRVQAVQDVPISISVIDSKSISARNNILVDEALRYVPGIKMNGDQVSIRGSSGFAFGVGSRVAYLLDGFPLLSGDNGDQKYDAIPIFNIDKIEVVKGAGSALYGTGAIGGVINLITKEPSTSRDLRLRLFSGIWTRQAYEQWNWTDQMLMKSGADLAFAQKFGNLGVMASASLIKDDSYIKYNDSFKWNVFGKLIFDLDKVKLSLLGSYAADDHADWVYWNSLDSATLPPTNTDLSVRIHSNKLTAFAEMKYIFTRGIFLIVRTGLFRTYVENTLDPLDPGYRQSDAISSNSEVLLNSMLSDNLALTSGLNFQMNLVDAVIYGKKTQLFLAPYLQAEYTPMTPLIITAGARLDIENTIGEKEKLEVSPKIGLSYKLTDNIAFRGSLGRGFRAPTVAERFIFTRYSGFTVEPNPELIPERSWSFELGANADFTFLKMPFQFDFAIYQNELYDLIEPTFVQNPTSLNIKFQNITRARIRGVELGLRALLFNWLGLETSFSAMEPKDLTLNETLKFRSKFMWYSKLTIPLQIFDLQIDYRFLSKVETIDERLGLQIRNYDARVPIHVVDLHLFLNLKKFTALNMRVSLNAKNLLNYYYTEMPGNLAPTRFLSLQIENSF